LYAPRNRSHNNESSDAVSLVNNREDGVLVKKTLQPASVREPEHAVFNWRDYDPATENGKNEFVVELTSYRDNLDALLRDRGKFVVIKGPEIVGVYRTQNSAMKAALHFAPRPVLVKRIVEEQPVREVGQIVP
jgi:hypothetical protein